MNLVPYLSRDPLILELGCGGGKRDVRAVGVDLLDLPGVDIMGDALEVLSSLPASSVDSIYSEHFMEHVPQPHSILREAERVLKPGGEFRAIIPHFSNPWFYSDRRTGRISACTPFVTGLRRIPLSVRYPTMKRLWRSS